MAAYLLGEGTAAETDAVMARGHAPALIDIEVTQVLRNLLRGGVLDVGRAGSARRDLADAGVRRHPDVVLLARAWELRDVCTTYDGLYVALAEALDAALLTRDARLARAAGHLVDVVVTG